MARRDAATSRDTGTRFLTEVQEAGVTTANRYSNVS